MNHPSLDAPFDGLGAPPPPSPETPEAPSPSDWVPQILHLACLHLLVMALGYRLAYIRICRGRPHIEQSSGGAFSDLTSPLLPRIGVESGSDAGAEAGALGEEAGEEAGAAGEPAKGRLCEAMQIWVAKTGE